MVSYSKPHIWSYKTQKMTKFFPRKKTKIETLDEYISNTDTIYSSDLNALGFNVFTIPLKAAAVRLNVIITKLNNTSWSVEKIKTNEKNKASKG